MQQTFVDVLLHFSILVGALIFLIFLAWNLRLHYVNALYLKSIPWVILEIVPPKDVFKSPEAMELVLNSLHGGGFGNWYERYWKGELAQTYSLEIASIEGNVHFYVRFHKKFRKVFEAQLYSQYPQAQVKEVEDYTKRVPEYRKDGDVSLFAYNLKLKKEDPYPIKTYIDYGLDRAIGSLDEEQRIDPITPMLETMGSIGVGEQMWVQINIRQDTKRFEVKKGDVVEKGKSWKDKSREIIEGLKAKANTKDPEGKTIQGRLSRGEQQVIEAIERHRNKQGFDCGIRVVYLAEKGHFNADMIGAFTAMFRQFNTEDMNAFSVSDLTRFSNEPWKDPLGRRVHKMKKFVLSDYKDRSFFYGGFDFKKIGKYLSHPAKLGEKPMILTTEELATIFHLPGRVSETPTVGRIEATKGEPPANLPV